MTAPGTGSGKTGAEARELAATRSVTCREAEGHHQSLMDARERFEELTNRDLLVRSTAALKARGTYDPQQHGERDEKPLSAAEYLEAVALGEVLARHYRHPSRVHQAVAAGASWTQIAEATGRSPDQARRDYREWAAGQHRLWADYQGKFGMSDAEYASAVQRSAEPEAEAGR
jgi:hypothetical protein